MCKILQDLLLSYLGIKTNHFKRIVVVLQVPEKPAFKSAIFYLNKVKKMSCHEIFE
jgi:hypothetical protein